MNVQGKKIAVTGGSSGIGQTLAEALAAKGAEVLITGRRAAAVSDTVTRIIRSGGKAFGIAADVTTEEGRALTLSGITDQLHGLDILINNAGGVRAGRLEEIGETEVMQMIAVNLAAPILLSRATLPLLRQSGDAAIINISSGLALVGGPFYATYAATKAGIAMFGEALRRELKGEGIHVITVYPTSTDTAMMKSSNAGPELGFNREPVAAVVEAILEGIANDSFDVIRGGEARRQMIALNRENPGAVDDRFAHLKPALHEAVKGHSAL